jgi:hypothetical protein
VQTDADVRLRDMIVDAARIPIGEAVKVTFTLELVGGRPADVVIDYRVHYIGVRTTKAPKTFKLARRRLHPAQPLTRTFSHRFDHVSVRQIRPGRHTIDLQVNGHILGSITVHVDV